MPALSALAWLSFAAAVMLVIFAISQGQPMFFSPAIGAAISGVLFLAFDKMLVLLTQIRDRLPMHGAIVANDVTAPQDASATDEAVLQHADPNGDEEYKGHKIRHSGGVITAAGHWHHSVAEAKSYIDGIKQ